MSATAERLRDYLAHYGRIYPSAWKDAEGFRLNRGNKQLGTWPDWCFVPMAGAAATVHAVTSRAPFPVTPYNLGYDTAVLGALIPWRIGQGVYRFDPDLLEELWATPVDGDLPGEVLFQLPEYAVYVEAPETAFHGRRRVLGAFAHLEWDVTHKRAELRLLLDLGDTSSFVPLPVHLGGTLEEGLRDAVRYTTTLKVEGLSGQDLTREQVDVAARFLSTVAQPVVSCLLYLCSENAEYAGPRRPAPRLPGKLRGGGQDWRPPAKPTTWSVGERMGAALRRARAASADSSRTGDGTGRPVRGHVRKAHWHTFLTGPRKGEVPQTRVLRWLPPIPVNLDHDDERPVVIHRVDSDK